MKKILILLLLPVALSAQKARIFQCYDAHYASTDQYQPDKFYDGDITTQGGPRKLLNIYGAHRVVNGLKHNFSSSTLSQIRVIFDLTGALDLNDITHTFHCTSIRAYSVNAGSGQIIKFMPLDPILGVAIKTRAQVIADPGAYGFTAAATIANSGTNGWVTQSITATDARYWIMLIGADTVGQQVARFSEIEFQGTYNYDTTTVTKRVYPYAGSLPTQYAAGITYGSKAGSNWFGGYGLHTAVADGNARLFYPLAYGDVSTSQAIPTAYTFPYKFADVNESTIAALQATGVKYTFTNQAGSAYINSLGTGSVTPVDSLNGNPAYRGNYRRHADYLKQLALVGGSTPTGSINKFTGTHANGQGLSPQGDDGNENEGHDAFNTLDEFIQMSMDFDGDEGFYDGGWRSGDPNIKVCWPAMVDWDPIRIRSLYFYSQWLRSDKIFPADMGQVHKYFDVTDLHLEGVQRDNDQKIGSTSISAEQAHVIDRAEAFFRAVYAYLPTTFPIQWSETGRSHNATPAANETEASYIDQSSTPGFGSYSAKQAVAILNLREGILTAFTPFTVRHQYSMEEQNGSNLRFAAMGRADTRNGSFDLTNHYPEWNVNYSTFPYLKGYSPRSIVTNGDSTGYWQVKYQKYGTDSVCYISWFGSKSGQSASVPMALPGLTAVRELLPSFTSETPTTSTQAVSGGTLTRTITELPTLYFGNEAVTIPACVTNSSPSNGAVVSSTPSVTLAWNSSAGATSYDVWLFLSGGSPTKVATVTTTVYNTGALLNSSVYKFYIQPMNAAGTATCSTNYTTFSTTSPVISNPYKIIHLRRK